MRLIDEVKLPDENEIRTWVTRLTQGKDETETDYDPDAFEYNGPDSFALQASYWADFASRAALFGEGNLLLWPVLDGDYTIGGFIVTFDVGQAPQLRLATLHQDLRDVIGDPSLRGKDLIASLLTTVTQLAAAELANLRYRAVQPSEEASVQEPLNSMQHSLEFVSRLPALAGDPLREALIYLRNTVAQHPTFGSLPTKWVVVNIEALNVSDLGATLVLDLSDQTTIRLDVQRYPREGNAG